MDSSYYNDLYKQYKKEADGYQKDIRILTDIRDRISGDFRDEQNSVNKELSDLRSDLEKAVRFLILPFRPDTALFFLRFSGSHSAGFSQFSDLSQLSIDMTYACRMLSS